MAEEALVVPLRVALEPITRVHSQLRNKQERLRNRNGSKESEAGGTLQLVVAVGATMRVLLKSSKPCVTGEELIPPNFSESLYSEPRCH